MSSKRRLPAVPDDVEVSGLRLVNLEAIGQPVLIPWVGHALSLSLVRELMKHPNLSIAKLRPPILRTRLL